uniref:Uncharacterized protein n=1 Tax=Eptatretus burgeri TaxID=7764 RepID=A0A8C4WUI6_EPTBU
MYKWLLPTSCPKVPRTCLMSYWMKTSWRRHVSISPSILRHIGVPHILRALILQTLFLNAHLQMLDSPVQLRSPASRYQAKFPHFPYRALLCFSFKLILSFLTLPCNLPFYCCLMSLPTLASDQQGGGTHLVHGEVITDLSTPEHTSGEPVETSRRSYGHQAPGRRHSPTTPSSSSSRQHLLRQWSGGRTSSIARQDTFDSETQESRDSAYTEEQAEEDYGEPTVRPGAGRGFRERDFHEVERGKEDESPLAPNELRHHSRGSWERERARELNRNEQNRQQLQQSRASGRHGTRDGYYEMESADMIVKGGHADSGETWEQDVYMRP